MIPSWLVIGGVTFAVAFASSLVRPRDTQWFRRLRRPRWLTFEFAIPLIWTVIFICGAWSAYIVWESNPGAPPVAWLMAYYLLVEMVIIAYNPATLWTRSLKVGTVVGGIGFLLGIPLALLVWPISGWAALLLIPYLLWSPIGTYTTWEMDRLNQSAPREESVETESPFR